MSTIAPNQDSRSKRAWKEAFAGAAAGAFSRTAMAPVERVKLLSTYLLLLCSDRWVCLVLVPGTYIPAHSHSVFCFTEQLQGSVNFASTNQSAWKVASAIYKEEGIVAFWRGNLPSVMRVSGTAAVNFACMDYFKQVAVGPFFEKRLLQRQKTSLEQLQRRRKLVTSFVSGGLAGATSTTVMYPFEFLRTRLAMDIGKADKRAYHGMTQVVKKILASDGILGFYQGYGIALAGGIYYRILLLGGYDAVKSEVLERKNNITLSWVDRIAIAQGISLSAGTLSYPFDSVRRRMMMQAGVPKADRVYRNSIHCFATVWKKEGIRGFFLGLGPNIVRSVGGALLLVGYDSFRSLLQ